MFERETVVPRVTAFTSKETWKWTGISAYRSSWARRMLRMLSDDRYVHPAVQSMAGEGSAQTIKEKIPL
jgi:hypothetical protein